MKTFFRVLLVTVLITAGGFVMKAYAADGVHAFKMLDIDGNETDLSSFAGKTLLIVNTASECGFTPQYAGLQELYEKYHDQGFEVLAFPSNDFGGQEPGTEAEIKKFCNLRFNVTFQLFSKITVKGPDKHPLYRYLTEESAHPGEVQWNFNKFLIAPDGTVAARYPSKVKPMSEELTGAVESFLKS